MPWTMHPVVKIYQLFLNRRTGDAEDGEANRIGSHWLPQVGQHAFHFRLRVPVAGPFCGENAVAQHFAGLIESIRFSPDV